MGKKRSDSGGIPGTFASQGLLSLPPDGWRPIARLPAGHEADTALPTMLCAARTQAGTPH
jgi:hypothetical protein